MPQNSYLWEASKRKLVIFYILRQIFKQYERQLGFLFEKPDWKLIKMYCWILGISASFFPTSQLAKFKIKTVQSPDLTPRKQAESGWHILGLNRNKQDSGRNTFVAEH